MFVCSRGGEASIWFVLWGRKEYGLNMNLYKTLLGLKGWVTGKEWQDVPVSRLGKIELTESGPVEKIYWTTREAFLNQYEHL